MEYSQDEQRTPWPFDAPLVRVAARYDGAALALEVHGEADRYTAGQLLAGLMSTVRPDVVSVRVDLSDLAFCDLAGSDALHDFVDEAAGQGLSVELHGMSGLLAFIYTTYPSRPGRLGNGVLVGSRPAGDRHPADVVPRGTT